MKIKEFIGILMLGVALVGILFIGADRIAKIENGEMTLISQDQMDR